jgi:lipoprotein-anchoring transpeptidase ErfK/SrfK
MVVLGGCMKDVEQQPDTTRAGGEVASAVPATPAPDPAMRLEVDVAARTVSVYRNGTLSATHPVAVGSAEWPTQPGSWTVKQVVWNPDWIPPEESWAKDEKRRESGDPANPLGPVQLVYDAPRTIHGTNQPASIGKAVSHGSIRMANETAIALAREVMEAGGAPKDEAWITQTRRNKTVKQVIDLPTPIPIVVR